MALYKGLEWLHLEHFDQDIGNIQEKKRIMTTAGISENGTKKKIGLNS